MVQQEKQDEKKVYDKPELAVMGSVAELTESSPGNSGMIGNGNGNAPA